MQEEKMIEDGVEKKDVIQVVTEEEYQKMSPEEKDKLEKESQKTVEEMIRKGEVSRSSLGLCKNEGCYNFRRTGSAFCQPCSDAWHEKNDKEVNTKK